MCVHLEDLAVILSSSWWYEFFGLTITHELRKTHITNYYTKLIPIKVWIVLAQITANLEFTLQLGGCFYIPDGHWSKWERRLLPTVWCMSWIWASHRSCFSGTFTYSSSRTFKFSIKFASSIKTENLDSSHVQILHTCKKHEHNYVRR